MQQRMKQGGLTLAQIADFDEIIDVRSPSEFAEDHVPGARSCPVLDDEQRARVGTMYKQVSAFAAKKIGATLVAHNIADHIERHFLDRPRDWRPLVYCWRGGQRSGAMTHVLRQVGWNAQQLEGGYKAYRRLVVAELEALPPRLEFRVVSGPTGSGKSRLLAALGTLGAQVLDLEELAAHKGSVLGDLPGAPQPSQKMFESRLRQALTRLEAERPVFVEAESRRIGSVQVPEALIHAMRISPCVRISASIEARCRFLVRDYDYFLADPHLLKAKLEGLRALQSRDTLEHWRALIDSGEWNTLVAELLEQHYDPLYHRSQGRNYTRYADAPGFHTEDLSPAGIERLAREILDALTSA